MPRRRASFNRVLSQRVLSAARHIQVDVYASCLASRSVHDISVAGFSRASVCGRYDGCRCGDGDGVHAAARPLKMGEF